MKKALMFAAPGTYGPIGNCCAIADALYERGYSVTFADSGGQSGLIDSSRYAVRESVAFPAALSRKVALKSNPFWRILGIDTFVALFGLDRYDWLNTYVRKQIEIISEVAPDVLVGSWDFALGITGEYLGIPVVSVFQEPMHPSSNGFEWWNTDRSVVRPSTSLPALNQMLKKLGLQEAVSVEEVVSKGHLLVMPSLPELEPVNAADERIRYVGYMEWDNPRDHRDADVLASITARRGRVVYIYDHGVSYGLRALNAAIDLFAGTDATVVVAVGADARLEVYPNIPENFRYCRYVRTKDIFPIATVAITHGGAGSVMSCVHYKTPSVAVPTHSEREANARRLAAVGAGEVLELDAVTPEAMRGAIAAATSDLSRSVLQQLSDRSKELGGAARAADLIAAL